MKVSLNGITTQKIVNLQNGLKRLQIIVFSWLYGAFHQSDILGLITGNSHSSPLRLKIWRNCNLLYTPLNHRFQLFSYVVYRQSNILQRLL